MKEFSSQIDKEDWYALRGATGTYWGRVTAPCPGRFTLVP